jgi:hypothetical protein
MKDRDFQLDDTVTLISFPEIGKGKIIKVRRDDLNIPIYTVKLDDNTEFTARSYELSLTSST